MGVPLVYGGRLLGVIQPMLARVARALGEAGRPGRRDKAFRYGGEEFCLVMPGASAAEGARVLEVFRAGVESTSVDYEGKALRVTASVGICAFPDGAVDGPALFKNADIALYHAKEHGRNRVAIWQAEGGPTVAPPLVT